MSRPFRISFVDGKKRIIHDAVERLPAGPEASGAIPLEEALNEL